MRVLWLLCSPLEPTPIGSLTCRVQAFPHKSDLQRHYRIHTNERKYVCVKCDKSFIQKSALTVHTRTHTGEKPYLANILAARDFSQM